MIKIVKKKQVKVISPAFSLTKDDLNKVLIGLGIALLGGFITFLIQLPEMIDWGMWTPVVAALCSMLVNLIRKYVTEKKE